MLRISMLPPCCGGGFCFVALARVAVFCGRVRPLLAGSGRTAVPCRAPHDSCITHMKVRANCVRACVQLLKALHNVVVLNTRRPSSTRLWSSGTPSGALHHLAANYCSRAFRFEQNMRSRSFTHTHTHMNFHSKRTRV